MPSNHEMRAVPRDVSTAETRHAHGLPRAVVRRTQRSAERSRSTVRFEEIGAVPIGLELDKARTFLVHEVVKYRDIITKAGIAKLE